MGKRRRKEFEVKIEKFAFPGMGVGTCNEREIYVKGAIPGQTILTKGGRNKRGHLECGIKEVLVESSKVIKPQCPHFSNGCGGCLYQNLSYEDQLNYKETTVLDLFDQKHIAGFKYDGIKRSPDIFEYRNKMEYTFGDETKGGPTTLGLHARGKSFGIMTVDSCMLVSNDFNKILTTVLDFAEKNSLKHYRVMSREGFLRNLVIRKGINTGEIMVNLVTTTQVTIDFSPLVESILALELDGKVKSIIHSENDDFSDAVKIEKLNLLFGRDYIYDKLGELRFKITPLSFFQPNTKGAEKLYSIVKDYIGNSDDKTVFDLYCGTGTIGQVVAQKAKKVIGIELIEEAVISARANALENNLENMEFIAGDVAKAITTVEEKPDIIIVDPPRAGISTQALKYIIDFDAKEIVYVSCNPITLVENLKDFEVFGYKVDRVQLMDMFSMTPLVETVVKLSRNR